MMIAEFVFYTVIFPIGVALLILKRISKRKNV